MPEVASRRGNGCNLVVRNTVTSQESKHPVPGLHAEKQRQIEAGGVIDFQQSPERGVPFDDDAIGGGAIRRDRQHLEEFGRHLPYRWARLNDGLRSICCQRAAIVDPLVIGRGSAVLDRQVGRGLPHPGHYPPPRRRRFVPETRSPALVAQWRRATVS